MTERYTAGAAAKSFTFDLTAVPVVGAQVAVYRTSQTENLKLPWQPGVLTLVR